MAMQFADFDATGFLQDYWQQKPLLIRNPWKHWHNPVDPDELAGLACEEHVESRLISQDKRDWEMEHGPLPDDRFDRLGKEPWTLLVQAVDHHVPGVADLIEPFRFIPNWRIDDVMVSYAADGGGVGAHFDQYDVFLVQGLGQRRWQIGALCNDETPLLPHDHLRLLADFEPTDEWVLGPGDILYVPPRFAHNGVALGDDCMTYSIGFRAPSRAELVEAWSDDLLDNLEESDRYTDPPAAASAGAQSNPGEISPEALARLRSLIADTLEDKAEFARWFGKFATSPKNANIDWRPDDPADEAEIETFLGQGLALIRNPASRFSYVTTEEKSVQLFVDGECYACSGEAAAFARTLCAQQDVKASPSQASCEQTKQVIKSLLDLGCVAFENAE
jgi:50S ribosomal protein L16 3-hydroxylase